MGDVGDEAESALLLLCAVQMIGVYAQNVSRYTSMDSLARGMKDKGAPEGMQKVRLSRFDRLRCI